MAKEYDTILKEKGVYDEAPKSSNNKYFKLFFFLGIVISLLVIVISYVIYYNTILDNESIFFNNLVKLKDNYYSIYKDIRFDYDIKNNYVIVGNMDVGNDNYGYTFSKYANKVKKVVFNSDKNITYYYDGRDSFVKISSLGDFYIRDNKNQLNDLKYYKDNIKSIKKDFNSYLYDSVLDKNSYDLFNQLYNVDNWGTIVSNIKDNYRTNVTSDKYIRKLYFDGKNPIVEVNLILEKSDINNILGVDSGLQIKDDYQLNITMKNSAISNEIKEIKVVINNKTKNTRQVLLFKSKVLYYTDSKDNKYSIKYNENKNNIQIKKNNVLTSVVQISAKNNTNIYNYKEIDKIYTISLSVEKVKNNFEYGIETNIDDVARAVKISGEYKKGEAINENTVNAINLDSLNLEQQKIYKKSIKELLK